ncbi:alpha/beta fold hydrolase [Streptomyces sp. NBC_00335]|uniref:alpha/beta fold hydrolase n=1 Tax=unclassified Streptomyces TaxID=2593676 RepID=UPI00224DA6CF|nr:MULTISPECIES: alpha/beta fold hydrolase [unclassified Streptomyces]MCX5403738.1 alpha/beta fold hydrolase [Streptomyces sp. NBC_00086]
MRFLFVHGTGVRRERHDLLFALVRDRLTARFPGAGVDSCFWGERYGATLSAQGRSVPGLSAPGAAPGPDDEEIAEWGLLVADPLCELRVLAEAGWDTAADGDPDGHAVGHPEGHPFGHPGGAPDDDGFAMPGVQSAGERVLDLLAELAELSAVPDGGEQAALLLGTGLAAGFPAALKTVSRSAEAARAGARAVGEPQARELAKALARAVTAAALASAGAEADCTGAERDRLVELITARLGGDARVPGARAAAVLGRLAMRVTTQPLLNAWRGSLTVGATPALGDILRYQARGADLRAFLHERITAEPGPTVLIGHSLGGIALVDLLALAAARGEPVPGVELLVTVGSQAPFLHELGALAGIVPGTRLPYAFPRWLNVYDRQDVLSYLAEPVFPGDPRVSDQEIASRQPFPACHSAYWKQDSLYARIEQAVAEAEIG